VNRPKREKGRYLKERIKRLSVLGSLSQKKKKNREGISLTLEVKGKETKDKVLTRGDGAPRGGTMTPKTIEIKTKQEFSCKHYDGWPLPS